MNKKLVIIAGSGRSGTTWVQDCIAEANNLQTLFEPLHPVGVPKARNLAYKYRVADREDRELQSFLDKVMQGKNSSLWMNYRIRPDRFNPMQNGVANSIDNARRLLQNYRKFRQTGENGLVVKFIRANLMLPWLVARYQSPVLLVTRHPGAVIASRLKLGGEDWASQKALDRYRADREVVELIQKDCNIDITEPLSTVAALTCVWCIENVLPIAWSSTGSYSVVAYENLLAEPETEWQKVIRCLELANVPAVGVLKAPSQQVSEDMRDRNFSKSQLGKWRSVLKDEQLNDISTMLNRFNCTYYSVHNDLPTVYP